MGGVFELKSRHEAGPGELRVNGPSAPGPARFTAWDAAVLGLRRLLRGADDATGGPRRAARRGAVWARRWRSHGWTLREWLRRPGAGHFWIATEDAVDWARRTCEAEDLDFARDAVRGRLPILAARTEPSGPCWAWRRDLYSGYEWPLVPSHRLRIQRDDGSDIRTVWELSRCYYFLALARAYWATGDSTYRETFVRHVESWIADNPVGLGPHWASPMDVAIRSANWVLATVLLGPAVEIPDGFWARLLGNLYASGLFLERHPEWHPVYRGNHYVADGLGLVYLGVLFRGDPAGERWLRRGARILAREICHQVHDDGVSFEAALGYHRLVTEFFAYGGELLRLNVPGAAGAEYEARVRSMYRFIRQYLPDSGEAPMLGDADDGRLHAVSARGLLEPRRHALGLPERFWPESVEEGAIAFPQGGYYVLRKERDHAIIRCGAVGLNGAGSHDHADQLAFELVLGGRRVVADSGTYAYTRDLAARFAFRSSAAHGVVQVGSEEQNPIRVDRPWRVLADRTRARCVLCTQTATELRFEGVHYGYAHRPSRAVCRRAITVDIADGEWQVVDTIDGVGRESITWRLHLAPTLVEWRCTGPGTYEFLLPGSPAVRIALQVPAAMEPRVEESFMSDRYGVRVARPCITAAGELALPVSVIVTFLAGR